MGNSIPNNGETKRSPDLGKFNTRPEVAQRIIARVGVVQQAAKLDQQVETRDELAEARARRAGSDGADLFLRRFNTPDNQDRIAS